MGKEEEEIREQIAKLTEQLNVVIANRTAIKAVDDYTNEDKIKRFKKVHAVCCAIATSQFNSKTVVADPDLYDFYRTVMLLIFDDDILHRIQEHIESVESTDV